MSDPPVAAAERREILAEVKGLFEQVFVWGAWGRMLVSVRPTQSGALAVDDILVEEVEGEDATLDAAFTSLEARACLPAIAKAVEALSLLDGADGARLGGGTFIRTRAGDLAFIAGLVRAPSRGLDARRDELLAKLRVKNAALAERFGIGSGARLETDMLTGGVTVLQGGQVVAAGDQVVLGSFAAADRSWVWGAHNPTLEAPARKRCAELLDAVRDRSAWEITTPAFVTDEATTWALAALVADEHGLDGVAKIVAGGEGYVLLGLRRVAPAALA